MFRLTEISRSVCVLATAWLAMTGVGGMTMARAQGSLAAGGPEAIVDLLHVGLVQAAGLPTVEERYELLLPLVRATHDIAYIAELTVRRDWPNFSEDQRSRFLDAFASLSAMTYAARFAGVDAETFEFVSTAPQSEARAEVSTLIHRSAGDPVSLDYLLQRDEAGWRIVNIVADGVSDLALKRSEYRRILSEGDFEALMGELQRQESSLRAGD